MCSMVIARPIEGLLQYTKGVVAYKFKLQEACTVTKVHCCHLSEEISSSTLQSS